MITITTAIIKGGTGKTATAAALAQAAKADGKRVLCIDLDTQANLSGVLGGDPTGRGVLEVLEGKPIKEMTQTTTQGLTLLTASRNLANLKTTPGSIARLKEALTATEQDFDYCIIDTPPTLGEATYNGIKAANMVLMPLETDINSLQGMYQVLDIAARIGAAKYGAVLTRYDARPKINQYINGVIAKKCKDLGVQLFEPIRNGIAIREAAAMQKDLYSYAPNSKPAHDYMTLYKAINEILEVANL